MRFDIDLGLVTNSLSIVVNPFSFGLSEIGAAMFPNGSITAALRRGNAPNIYQNDSAATYQNNEMTLSISDPIPGAWYLSVYNSLNQTIKYTVVFTNTSCPSNTAGPNCTSSVIDLTNVYNVSSYTGTGDYQYFTLRNTSDLIVGVSTEKAEGIAPPIYASFLNYPTSDSNLISASGQVSNYLFGSTDLGNMTWRVAVLASSGQVFYIWANTNCPNNCMGDNYGAGNKTYGTCDAYTGLCACNSRYGNLTCTRTGLAVVWIVLIVIACAIILAIAVGVPVACYLRNRNRSRYERV